MKRPITTLLIALSFVLLSLSSAQAQGAATLELRSALSQASAGDEFSVDIWLKNPGAQPIISVRTWLSYDANALEGLDIVTEGSPFTLTAPGEDAFDAAEGHVKIGRSNISGGVKDVEVKVATVTFRVKAASPMTTVISPYDYQVTELGHTSVNIIEQGFPVNILSEAPEDLRLELNPGGAAAPSTPVEVQEPTTSAQPADIGGGLANLQRPQNLRVATGPGYADLKWDMAPSEPNRTGYNIYYGKTSGEYTRRRSAGNVNRYRLDGLNNNETYYFALTAYDSRNRESDYSDEVGIIINEPLSSTSPFEEILQSLLARIPGQPRNGPLIGWALFMALGLSGAVLFRSKKPLKN